MFRLKRLNVERVTNDEAVRDKLIKDGYELVVSEGQDNDLDALTVDKLKELAKEKGIEGLDKMRKAELIQAIRDGE